MFGLNVFGSMVIIYGNSAFFPKKETEPKKATELLKNELIFLWSLRVSIAGVVSPCPSFNSGILVQPAELLAIGEDPAGVEEVVLEGS